MYIYTVLFVGMALYPSSGPITFVSWDIYCVVIVLVLVLY